MTRTLLIALSLSLATPAFSFEIEMEKWFKEEPEAPKRKPQPQVRGWVAVKPKPRLHVEITEAQVCIAAVTTVGDEARTKEAAELQARQHWMKQVRFDHGEKYLELGNARDVFFQCSRSDFPITGGKIGAVADAVTHSWRCKIRAIPCVATMTREDK